MPVLDLSFEWPVDDAGYEIAAPKKSKGPAGRGVPISTVLGNAEEGDRIVRKGGQLRTTRPLEINSTLFIDFARLDERDESCLQFANDFGYLGVWLDEKADDRVGPNGEPLLLWRDTIADMRRLVSAWQANPDTFSSNQEFTITLLDVSLVPIDGKPTLRIRPRSLIGAIHLQFAQAVATGLDIRTCDHCGKLFETGGAGRTRKARFCSDRCRSDYHVSRRKTS